MEQYERLGTIIRKFANQVKLSIRHFNERNKSCVLRGTRLRQGYIYLIAAEESLRPTWNLSHCFDCWRPTSGSYRKAFVPESAELDSMVAKADLVQRQSEPNPFIRKDQLLWFDVPVEWAFEMPIELTRALIAVRLGQYPSQRGHRQKRVKFGAASRWFCCWSSSQQVPQSRHPAGYLKPTPIRKALM